MTHIEKVIRLNELIENRIELKSSRDFHGLAENYIESIKYLNDVASYIEIIPQLSYCFARLGYKDEAQETMYNLREYKSILDEDELFRIIAPLSFFISTDIEDLNLLQINTIKNFLEDPVTSRQISNVIFDYNDFINNAKVFDYSRLTIKQSNFPKPLISLIFKSMQRYDDEYLYYNKEKNIVEQEISCHLINLLSDNPVEERRKLANKIMSTDNRDVIMSGIHHLIPRLELEKFLHVLSGYTNENNKIIEFIEDFKILIENEYKEITDSYTKLFFSDIISDYYKTQITTWSLKRNIDINILNVVSNKTKEKIALDYLLDINK